MSVLTAPVCQCGQDKRDIGHDTTICMHCDRGCERNCDLCKTYREEWKRLKAEYYGKS